MLDISKGLVYDLALYRQVAQREIRQGAAHHTRWDSLFTWPRNDEPRKNKEKQMTMEFPNATDPSKVGSYSAGCQAGGGESYDDAPEWRVWVHAPSGDYYEVFVAFAEALAFRTATDGAERPLALVYADGNGAPGERVLAEWRPEWLAGARRTA